MGPLVAKLCPCTAVYDPCIVHKALQLCNSTQCRDQNVKAPVLGFGYKHYKWLYLPLKCRLTDIGLHALCDYHTLKQWALEGTSMAVALGRGGGCTHIQESSQYSCRLSVKSRSENPKLVH